MFTGFNGGEVHASELNIGASATEISEIRKVSQSVDLPGLGAGATADVVVAVAGVDANDIVILMQASLPHGVGIESVTAGADQVTLRCSNVTAGVIDPAATTMVFLVLRVAG